jgi:hypothetical protein
MGMCVICGSYDCGMEEHPKEEIENWKGRLGEEFRDMCFNDFLETKKNFDYMMRYQMFIRDNGLTDKYVEYAKKMGYKE